MRLMAVAIAELVSIPFYDGRNNRASYFARFNERECIGCILTEERGRYNRRSWVIGRIAVKGSPVRPHVY